MKKDLQIYAKSGREMRAFSFLLLAFYFLLFAPVSLLSAAPVAVHRYHTSLTRMDYNEEDKTIEISMQLFTHDVEPVLEKLSGKTINLEQAGDTDKVIQDYLKDNFILKKKDGSVGEIKWVGKETSVDTTYLYFEIPFESSPEGANLQNTIFFETFAEQTNLVICHYEGKKADLLFKVGDPLKTIAERLAGVN